MKQAGAKSVHTTVRFTPEEWEAIKIELVRRRTSFQQVVESAVRQWMGGPAPQASSDLQAENQDASLYLDFLANGDRGQVELVKHALDLHAQKRKATRKRNSA